MKSELKSGSLNSIGNAALIERRNQSQNQQETKNPFEQPKMEAPINKESLPTEQFDAHSDTQLIAQNRNKVFDSNLSEQNQESVIGGGQENGDGSGISCVYQKVMRVPSIYSLSGLDSKNPKEHSTQEKMIVINHNHYAAGSFISSCNENNQISYNKEMSLIENATQKEQIRKESLSLAFFGEDTSDQEKRIRKNSPFGNFKSWKLVHLIVKTGDNIKQEQFAVQLIYQFDQIFKHEGLDLKLTPYEIVSLGPQAGILEMIKNSITFDGLKKQLHEDHKDIRDLHQFFNIFYGKQELKKAQTNFCSSLVAYSLVCYFLQVKDRHNGNILLQKSGCIAHIDFGFFLSNAPGKGLAFEQNVPFKLLSEYIEILGGVESELFSTFRRLFFKGFQAAIKHQDKILILVKMLYSGHGPTLPCFEKGEQCIRDLEIRFNPPNTSTDPEMSLHCNMLINSALDNWRARWYDKWQYFCQGIFY